MRLFLFVLMLIVASPLVANAAGSQQEPPPVCWFYLYQWTYYQGTGGQGNFAFFPVAGYGTGMAVTSGLRPTAGQMESIEKTITETLLKAHPLTDRKMPPPRTKIMRTAEMECPPPRDVPRRLD